MRSGAATYRLYGSENSHPGLVIPSARSSGGRRPSDSRCSSRLVRSAQQPNRIIPNPGARSLDTTKIWLEIDKKWRGGEG